MVEGRKVEILQGQLEAARQAAREFNSQYQDSNAKLSEVEASLALVEGRNRSTEAAVGKLEEELNNACSQLKALEMAGDKKSRKGELYEEKIKVLKEKCSQIDARADSAENAAQRLE